MDKAVNSRLLYQLSYRGSRLLIVIHVAGFDKMLGPKMAEVPPPASEAGRAIGLSSITVTRWPAFLTPLLKKGGLLCGRLS